MSDFSDLYADFLNKYGGVSVTFVKYSDLVFSYKGFVYNEEEDKTYTIEVEVGGDTESLEGVELSADNLTDVISDLGIVSFYTVYDPESMAVVDTCNFRLL